MNTIQGHRSAHYKKAKPILKLYHLQDRVSLITGSREAISDVVQLLVKKMKERHQELNDSDVERERTMKIVVANSTIGMVIGKVIGNW